MTALFFSMIAIIAIIFIVFYLFIGNMLKPLKIMINMLEKISSNWDLTQRLDVRQKDESGTLAEYFNRTFDRMSSLIKDIKNRAFVLSDNSEELKFTMIESSGAVYTIETNIHNMRKMVLAQVDEVGSSIDSLGNIISGLDLLNKNITIQADAVSQSSSSIEEMLANISSVTQTLVKNTANIKSLAESSEAGRMDLQKVSQDIQEIARESEGLLEINSVMQNIASQTNLLSMNAAIEAAHAGESGKGFAVVADEIRKLAENSGKQSKTISAVLKKIKNSIDTITKSTVYVLDRFGVIEREINVVSTQETQIRNAMEEQEVGSRHILDAVMQLNDVTSEVKNSSLEMANISREAMTQSDKLKHLSSNVEEGIDSMTESSEKITNAVTRVQEISQENFDNINILNSEVGKFKVD
ncbi:MAG: methyl-accepting chemotaxis protein, partial [Treponema sp.]|nr:methyl-accepting chemotaxis protein [Treponema sp.]